MKPGLAQRLGAQGRDGDTLVAHISPLEAAILKLLGGSGTRNPKTGLLEFKYGGDTNEGGAHGFGGRASMGGHAGNGRSQAIGTGIKDNTGLGDADVDRLAAGPSFSSPGFSVTRNRTIGNVGLSQADIDKLAAGPDFQDPSFGGEIDRTHRDMDAYGHSVMDMASWAAFNHEFADEADENGETFLDKLANGLLNHVLSIQERAIFDPADPMRTSAQWGFDAPGFIGGLIGNRLAGPAGG
ncbi:MAG TPA: hypothetical protein VHA10_18620, partial [Hypericibacter adhaerens]|uniref:hypothetical protein n=1 Tax=Hypericibacter adhaerens TaxID=2602016 RepID=UPI002BF10E1C